MHPNGYTKEMIKEILGTSWPVMGDRETGNEMRKRIGREIREGKRPKPTYPSAESRAKNPNFDENGKYIYPKDAGFNYVEWCKTHPDSTESGSYGNKVS